jgi:hypothetical protein
VGIPEFDDERSDLRMQFADQLTERDRPRGQYRHEHERDEGPTMIALRIFRTSSAQHPADSPY